MDEEHLSDTERRLVSNAAAGEELDLRAGDAPQDDPAAGAQWPDDRVVRAQVLVALCTGVNAAWPVHARGVRLRGARIDGALDLEAVTLAHPLMLQDCCLPQQVTLCEAQIPTLRLAGSHLSGLDARQLHIRGDVVLDAVRVSGTVVLAGARIGGLLDLAGARLTNPDGRALNADRLTVDGSMFCSEGFSAEGEVRLLSARISGQLDLAGASLSSSVGAALGADGLTVDGGMFCSEGFSAEGEVRLLSARISGLLDLAGARLTNPDGRALNAERIEVGHALFLWFEDKPGGRLDFTHGRVGGYHDAEATWPDPGQLLVDGLTYDAIEGKSVEGKPVELKERGRWLELTPDYRPQPYEQLIAVSRRAGHDRDARHIAIAKQVARRKRGYLRRYQWLWSVFLGGTVRHGYWPWLALVWLVGLWAVGVAAFFNADPAVAMTALGEPTPTFRPAVYAADVVVPIINLRQQEFWVPDPTAPWGWLRAWWHTAAIPLGWLFATVGVAGVTGLLKKD